MKKRAGGNDDGGIPRKRRGGTSGGQPGRIIAVVSVTVGLFEYLIEGREKRREREEKDGEGKDRDGREEERSSLAPVLSHSLRSSGNGERDGGGETDSTHSGLTVSSILSLSPARRPLSLSLPPREHEGPGGENPGMARRV